MEEPIKSNINFLLSIIQNHYTVAAKPKTAAQLNREKWLIPRFLPFNRWFLMPAAFIVQFCCGSIYSWSVFNKPIDILIYNENLNMAPITFYIAVGFLGFAAALMGPSLERHGPFLICALGATLFFIGHLLAALALYLKQMWLVFVGYGIVSGFGLGICCICPVSALQKWFPDKRGLAAGLAVCGFGTGSIVISKVQLPLMDLVELPLTFVILGSCYFTLMTMSAHILRTPPPDFSPTPETSSQSQDHIQLSQLKAEEANESPSGIPEITLVEAITSTDFRLLMIMFSTNIIFGLVLISRLSNIVTDVFGKTAEEASTVVAINGVSNLVGLLVVGAVSDWVGRKNCFVVVVSAQLIIIGCFSIMTNLRAYWTFIISMWIVRSVYGSLFGIIPAILADKFGPKNIGACYGIILTGWSFAGITGGLIFTAVFNSVITNGQYDSGDPFPYNVNVWWIFGLHCIGWLAILFVKPTKQDLNLVKKIRRTFNPVKK